MRLKNGFYTCTYIENVEGGFEAEVRLNAESPVFEGHFPGQPIVPGVCTMTILKELVSENRGRQLRFSAVKECKFTGAVDPEKDTGIHYSVSTDGTHLSALADCNGRNILKIKATLTEDKC